MCDVLEMWRTALQCYYYTWLTYWEGVWWPSFRPRWNRFCWPFYVKDKSSNLSKVYVCLFTCCSTRVLHLELTDLLSAESFLLVFQRFVGRRGFLCIIWSDNAKTFKDTSKEIQKIVLSPEVLSTGCITWKFIVERAWGGFWERMVRSVKHRNVLVKSHSPMMSWIHDQLKTTHIYFLMTQTKWWVII